MESGGKINAKGQEKIRKNRQYYRCKSSSTSSCTMVIYIERDEDAGATLIELVTVKYVTEASSSPWTRIVPQTWRLSFCNLHVERFIPLSRLQNVESIDSYLSSAFHLGRWLFTTIFFFYGPSACFREWRKIVRLYFREE